MIMGVGEGGIGDKGGLASLPTFLSYMFGGHLTLPDVGFFWNLERKEWHFAHLWGPGLDSQSSRS